MSVAIEHFKRFAKFYLTETISFRTKVQVKEKLVDEGDEMLKLVPLFLVGLMISAIWFAFGVLGLTYVLLSFVVSGVKLVGVDFWSLGSFTLILFSLLLFSYLTFRLKSLFWNSINAIEDSNPVASVKHSFVAQIVKEQDRLKNNLVDIIN